MIIRSSDGYEFDYRKPSGLLDNLGDDVDDLGVPEVPFTHEELLLIDEYLEDLDELKARITIYDFMQSDEAYQADLDQYLYFLLSTNNPADVDDWWVGIMLLEPRLIIATYLRNDFYLRELSDPSDLNSGAVISEIYQPVINDILRYITAQDYIDLWTMMLAKRENTISISHIATRLDLHPSGQSKFFFHNLALRGVHLKFYIQMLIANDRDGIDCYDRILDMMENDRTSRSVSIDMIVAGNYRSAVRLGQTYGPNTGFIEKILRQLMQRYELPLLRSQMTGRDYILACCRDNYHTSRFDFFHAAVITSNVQAVADLLPYLDDQSKRDITAIQERDATRYLYLNISAKIFKSNGNDEIFRQVFALVNLQRIEVTNIDNVYRRLGGDNDLFAKFVNILLLAGVPLPMSINKMIIDYQFTNSLLAMNVMGVMVVRHYNLSIWRLFRQYGYTIDRENYELCRLRGIDASEFLPAE